MSSRVARCTLAPGLEISRVLTGLWQIADMEREGGALDPEASAAAMAPYVDAGLTTFDMADHYGSAEEVAGHFRATRDQPAEVLTKWVPAAGVISRADVRAAVERALHRLQTQRIDLLQFHAWSYADPSWLDALGWLQELRDEGLIGHLGLTNTDTAHLRMVLASGIDVVSNQVCFSLLDQRAAGEMSALCRLHGVKLLAFGTVAGGFLSDRWLGQPEPDWDGPLTWSQMKYGRFIRVAGGWNHLQSLLRVLDSVARRHDVSIANVACRSILEQPAVGGIIVGARLGRSQHVQETVRLFDFKLDDSSRAEIAEAVGALESIPGDCGDEYRKPPFLTASGDLSHHLETIPPPYEAEQRADGRSIVLTGTPWEHLAGFARAVRRGDRVWVSGTTATHGDQVVGGDDVAAQLTFVIDKIEGALRSLGATLEDVVRTRIYIHDIDDWKPVSQVHGARFGHIMPANTLVQAGIIGDAYRVEMEVEAVVTG